MKKLPIRLAGVTLTVAVLAAGLALAQSDGSATNGPGGRSTDTRGSSVASPPVDPSDPNALPSISPATPPTSAPATGSTTTPSTNGYGSAVDSQAATQRAPRADRN